MHHSRRLFRALRLSPLACLLALSPLAAADDGMADRPPPVADIVSSAEDTLAQRLDAQGVGYERDEDGDYRVIFVWQQEDRSQQAFVAGSAHVFGDSAVREVFSPAAPVPEGGFSVEQADMLLRDSQRNILGGWEIAGDTLFYVIKLHDDADGARFEQALEVAAQLADDMELQLTGEDALLMAVSADPRFWQPDVTVATVVMDGGRVLCIEERVDGRLVINQPAGHLEPDESLLHAAVRETLEESGWTVELTGFIGTYLWKSAPRSGEADGRHFLRFAFAARPLIHDPARALDEGIEKATWFTPAQLQAEAARHRSPLVWQVVADCLAGQRFPLSAVRQIP